MAHARDGDSSPSDAGGSVAALQDAIGLGAVVSRVALRGAAVGGMLTAPLVAKCGRMGLWGYALGLLLAAVAGVCRAELAGVVPHTGAEATHIYIREALGQRVGRVLAFVYCVLDLYCLVPFEAAMLFYVACGSLPPAAACFLFAAGVLARRTARSLAFVATDALLVLAVASFATWVASRTFIPSRPAHGPTAFASFSAPFDGASTVLAAAGYALYDMRALDGVARYGTAPLADTAEKILPVGFALGGPVLALALLLKTAALTTVFPMYEWSWGGSAWGRAIGACLALAAGERLAAGVQRSAQRAEEGYECALPAACAVAGEGPSALAAGGVFAACLMTDDVALLAKVSVALVVQAQLLPLAAGAAAHRSLAPMLFRPFVTLLHPVLPVLAVCGLLCVLAMTPSSSTSESPVLEASLALYFAALVAYLLFAQARGFWPFTTPRAAGSRYHAYDAHERLYGRQLAPGLQYDPL
eukprot:TRINITY_DN13877_c0_g1_i1.p1 TRINITY_DN13877_c0_g1~~TRINITY_DN13877_c0_g1_i1.p1  ORF type:complete len:527 (+),score=111.85 TRINITY_DN13877_c0_g1_i1:167-1582(+)